ncbi:MAG TPA: peptide chain release factor 1 [Polyangiaceae bacterium]|jgi:peptide chain release factor 1|nr:peptide chain release factor 1 [Polyangiaceae bacterium]
MIPVGKLESLVRRYAELDQLLCDPKVFGDPQKLNAFNRERSGLSNIVEAFHEWRTIEKHVAEDREVLNDPELGPLVKQELPELEEKLSQLEQRIFVLLLPKDPNDEKNTLLEIRAGTGGEEAALFAADLFRMYSRYAETRGWKIELMSSSEAAAGGLKEVILLVTGNRVFSSLKYEGGVHRVQRVPATEAQGRIHTSTATVAVLPEADEVELVIDDKDLRFDIAASGGPGGQGVNTTNSSVQITHLPTGMVVRCQDERSQIKNKAKGLKILRSRLLEIEQEKQDSAIRDERRGMVKAGDRSEKIRTYNFPQNRLTDHRVGLTLYKLDRVMDGDLTELLDAVGSFHQAALLQANQSSEHGNPSGPGGP